MSQSTLPFRHALSGSVVKRKSGGFRPDIQGLRALAVVAVILDHMLAYPSGGFVGVDVFFVISGFVITASLLREHITKGRISFVDFYRHRARRILPAASLVLIVTVGASWAIFLGERARTVLWDGVWAALFGANWRFAATGTDYLQSSGPISPLQHYWSLSVEEQFYFVWPALLVLTFGLIARRLKLTHGGAQRVLGLIVFGIIVLSLAFALWETVNAPTVAYFSTFSRAWELALGALLAVCVPVFAQIPDRLRPILQWVGLVGIIASLFVIDTETPFPAPGALLPVLAAGLVILGGVGGQKSMRVLTNKAVRYVGDISYSLYLWHFPVIILTRALMPTIGLTEYAVMVALIAMLSVASYHFVENPIRKSGWLEPRHKRQLREPFNLSQGNKMLGLALLAVAAIGMSALAFRMSAPVPVENVAVPQVTFDSTAKADQKTPAQQLQLKVALALQATTWPELQPSLEDLGYKAWAPEITQDGCLSVSDENFAKCSYGPPSSTRTAVVVGDSIAASWVPAIRSSLEGSGYRVQMLTLSGCPPFEVTLKDQTKAAQCSQHRAWTQAKLDELKPSLILVSQAYEDNLETADQTPQVQVKLWKEAGVRFLSTLPQASQVAYLQGPKGGKDLKECATRTSTPKDCISDINGFGAMIEKANSDAIAASVTSSRKMMYVKTEDWFCSSGKCPAFIGSTPVRIDASHLSGAFSASLGPVLAEALAPFTR